MNDINHGENDADGAIRALFAEPYGEPAPDQLFVAGVMGRIARRRRVRTAVGASLAAVLLAGTIFAVPTVTASTDMVASLPLLLTVPFQDLLTSPIGFALSLPFGILLLTLSTLRATRFNT